MLDLYRVGEKIAARRKERGLSQNELADMLYITRQALSKWENGLSAPPLDAVAALAKIFGTSADDILCLSDAGETPPDENDLFAGHDRSAADRMTVIEKILSGKLPVDLTHVLWQMSPAERMLILKNVKEGRIGADPCELFPCLSRSEQQYMKEYFEKNG